MKPKILFRTSLAEEDELEIAKRHFEVVGQRSALRDALVVGRYSVLPYYEELENDLRVQDCSMINSYRAHRYIADLRNWYEDFEDVTPKTWFRFEDVPRLPDSSYVLKGATNSRKALWRTHMFAETRADVMTIACRLMDDTMIGAQGIYVRQFEQFVTFGVGIQGLPITDEWRVFCLDGRVLAHGFYWSEHVDDIACDLEPSRRAALAFASQLAPRLKRARFVVMDVARHVDGRWRLIELNDGQMSGLSCVDPDVLYQALANQLRRLS